MTSISSFSSLSPAVPAWAALAMFKDAFQQLNSAAPQQGAGKASTLTEVDHAMLTGLADFSASLADTPGSPNPMRPGEADTFAYQASQTTSVGGHGPLHRTLSQKQHTHLMLGLLKAAQQLGGQAPQDGARRQQALATIHDTVLLQSDPARLRSAGTGTD